MHRGRYSSSGITGFTWCSVFSRKTARKEKESKRNEAC
jgi:hypothetical protein